MASAPCTHYFLGANSRYGFRSLYGGFCRAEDRSFLHVIKGGPGCGKSSFMRRIGAAAEREGLAVEYILCSGDPDSLDGVFIPALGIGYVDGTAPHSMDVAYPGCGGMYLDLGRFYDSCALRTQIMEIMDINRRYKALYASAYAAIAAGSAALPRCFPGIWGREEKDKVAKKLSGLCRRELRSGSGKGRVTERFLEAMSCKGPQFLDATLSALCEKIYLLDNELGLGHYYLQNLLPRLLENGLDTVVCRDCLDPELISALIIPELSMAFVCSGPGREELNIYRHVRLDALPLREELSRLRPELRRAKRLSRESLSFAVDTLAGAKALHDELENIYNPHVDFDGVYEEAERHISLLFGPGNHG